MNQPELLMGVQMGAIALENCWVLYSNYLYKCKCIHNSKSHHSPKLDTTQMSVNGGMNKINCDIFIYRKNKVLLHTSLRISQTMLSKR